jgi:hypothetical protein
MFYRIPCLYYLITCKIMFKAKFVLISVLLSLVFAPDVHAQLIWDVTQSDSSAVGYLLTSVSCYGNTCTALAEEWDSDSGAYRSIFWRSEDAGATWKRQDPGLALRVPSDSFIFPNYAINKVDQIDSLRAIAIGYGGLILATNDGGNTWEKQQCPVISNLIDIDCLSATEGIIIGDGPSTILTLSEGGWFVAPFVPLVLNASGFCHSYGDGKFRVLTNYGPLYTTLDGWHTVDSVAFPHRSADFLGWYGIETCDFGFGDTIIVGCASVEDSSKYWPLLIRTFDGGDNWQFIIDSASRPHGFSNISPIFDDTIISLNLVDSDSGVFFPGLILLSTDLGATWRMDTLLFNKNEGSRFAGPLGGTMAFTSNGSLIGAFYEYDTAGAIVGNIDSSFFAKLNPSLNSGVQILESSSREFPVYPNPAENVLNVKSFSDPISITDPLGRSYAVKQTGNTLDISSLPSGVYFISDGVSRAKFVKQ